MKLKEILSAGRHEAKKVLKEALSTKAPDDAVLKSVEKLAQDIKESVLLGVEYQKISVERSAELIKEVTKIAKYLKDLEVVNVPPKYKSKIPYEMVEAAMRKAESVASLPERLSNFAAAVSLFLCWRGILPLTSGPGLYGDLGREAKEVLYSGYTTDTAMIINSKPLAGATSLTASSYLSNQGGAGYLLMEMTQGYINLKVKADVNQNLAASVTASLGEGFLTRLCASYPRTAETKALVEYCGPSMGISSSCGLGDSSATFSVLCGSNTVAAGSFIELNSRTGNLNWSLGLSAKQDRNSLSLSMAGFQTISLHLYHGGPRPLSLFDRFLSTVPDLSQLWSLLYDTTGIGAAISFAIPTRQVKLEVGIDHKITSTATVKAYVSSCGVAKALLKQEIWSKSTLALCSEFDLLGRHNSSIGVTFMLNM